MEAWDVDDAHRGSVGRSAWFHSLHLVRGSAPDCHHYQE